MSDMKCPFCQQELRPLAIGWCCDCGFYANKELWQELIRTRKTLDVAKDIIRHADWFFDGDYIDAKTMHNEIKCAIKAITALEQKDVK